MGNCKGRNHFVRYRDQGAGSFPCRGPGSDLSRRAGLAYRRRLTLAEPAVHRFSGKCWANRYFGGVDRYSPEGLTRLAMLASVQQLLTTAQEGRYALGAFNVYNLEGVMAVIRAAESE